MDVSQPGPPAHWECDVFLSDGVTLHLRPIRTNDAAALVAFHSRLSPDSVYYRFFAPHPALSEGEVSGFTTVDHVDRVAFVAELGQEMVALASYDRLPDSPRTRRDRLRRQRPASRTGNRHPLLEHLAAAGERGITTFVAETLIGNAPMLEVFRAAGFEEQVHMGDGVVMVELDIAPNERAFAAIERREQHAEATSVARLLSPRSVAVIGASGKLATIGHQVLRNLLAGEFVGPVYPVNPRAPHVPSVKAGPPVLDIPDEVDLAVLAVPAAAVADVVRQYAEKGVAGLVVLSAGFARAGAGRRGRATAAATPGRRAPHSRSRSGDKR